MFFQQVPDLNKKSSLLAQLGAIAENESFTDEDSEISSFKSSDRRLKK